MTTGPGSVKSSKYHYFEPGNRVHHHHISLGLALAVCAHMTLCFNLEDDFAAFRLTDMDTS